MGFGFFEDDFVRYEGALRYEIRPCVVRAGKGKSMALVLVLVLVDLGA